MKKNLIIIFRYLWSYGFNPVQFLLGIKNIIWYRQDYIKLVREKHNKDFPITLSYPCLHDKNDNSGTSSGHYYHQDLLIAQKIYDANPQRHIDIWSRVDWFVAHIASFREIEILDIRKLESKSKNIIFVQRNTSRNLYSLESKRNKWKLILKQSPWKTVKR